MWWKSMEGNYRKKRELRLIDMAQRIQCSTLKLPSIHTAIVFLLSLVLMNFSNGCFNDEQNRIASALYTLYFLRFIYFTITLIPNSIGTKMDKNLATITHVTTNRLNCSNARKLWKLREDKRKTLANQKSDK